MCGISGIIGQSASQEKIQQMTGIMKHRGPDDTGFYSADKVVLGHNRLSIIDLSAAGHQPMFDFTGRVVIVFNGEVYNYLEIKEEIGDRYPFKTKTDTEVVLASYLLFGESCVDKFNGMFALAIYDTVAKSVFILRDRIGIKPLFYSVVNDSLFFASEIKALFAAGVPKKVNYETVHTYLTQGYYDHSENTFYENVFSCPQGHSLQYNQLGLTIKSYWDLHSISSKYHQTDDKRGKSDILEELHFLMQDSVKLRLRSDVPVGIHLSGGLDSSILLAYLERAMPDEGIIRATTVVYSNPKYNENSFASGILKRLNLEHTLAEFSLENIEDILRRSVFHQDQPFGGISTMSSLVLDETVRKSGVIVALEGQGGDELFGGYNYFFEDYILDLGGVNSATMPLIEQHAKYQQFSPELLIERIKRASEGGERLYQDGTAFLKTSCIHPEFLKRYQRENTFPEIQGSRFNTARFRDIRYTKIPRVLRFNDAQSMASSIELRVPILDYRIVEFAMTLPHTMFFRDGITKSLLRDLGVQYHLLPEEFAYAPKRTIVTPQREWLQNELKEFVNSTMNESLLFDMNILQKDVTLSAVEDFLTGKDSANSNYIWQWINLDLMLRNI